MQWGVAAVGIPLWCLVLYVTVTAKDVRGEQLALASNGEITAGFWDQPSEPFQSMKYLCDPRVFHAKAEECAYVFLSEHHARLAAEEAQSRGVELELLTEYIEDGWYIATADVNLME